MRARPGILGLVSAALDRAQVRPSGETLGLAPSDDGRVSTLSRRTFGRVVLGLGALGIAMTGASPTGEAPEDAVQDHGEGILGTARESKGEIDRLTQELTREWAQRAEAMRGPFIERLQTEFSDQTSEAYDRYQEEWAKRVWEFTMTHESLLIRGERAEYDREFIRMMQEIEEENTTVVTVLNELYHDTSRRFLGKEPRTLRSELEQIEALTSWVKQMEALEALEASLLTRIQHGETGAEGNPNLIYDWLYVQNLILFMIAEQARNVERDAVPNQDKPGQDVDGSSQKTEEGYNVAGDNTWVKKVEEWGEGFRDKPVPFVQELKPGYRLREDQLRHLDAPLDPSKSNAWDTAFNYFMLNAVFRELRVANEEYPQANNLKDGDTLIREAFDRAETFMQSRDVKKVFERWLKDHLTFEVDYRVAKLRGREGIEIPRSHELSLTSNLALVEAFVLHEWVYGHPIASSALGVLSGVLYTRREGWPHVGIPYNEGERKRVTLLMATALDAARSKVEVRHRVACEHLYEVDRSTVDNWLGTAYSYEGEPSPYSVQAGSFPPEVAQNPEEVLRNLGTGVLPEGISKDGSTGANRYYYTEEDMRELWRQFEGADYPFWLIADSLQVVEVTSRARRRLWTFCSAVDDSGGFKREPTSSQLLGPADILGPYATVNLGEVLEPIAATAAASRGAL